MSSPKVKAHRYLAFDRDGTLIELIPYLKDAKKVVLLPGAKILVHHALSTGYKTALITNQSAIGRGLASHEQVEEVNAEVESLIFEKKGGGFDLIKYCPHLPSAMCPCRKPRVGLLENEVRQGLIDLDGSFYVGDSESDILFANRLGLKSILITSNSNINYDASYVVSNLLQIVPIIDSLL
jgi:D-glycero-D-manno-heptose 1,7-bisphosphate phosphatase